MLKFCLIFSLFVFPHAALASKRVALVIGMGQYDTIPALDNTLNDANGLSKTLAEIGFEVTKLLDSSSAELRDALSSFQFRAETADLALIYFAGHGVEVLGENFLIPVDAVVSSNRDIQRQGVSLKELLVAVDGARKMRIVILDSCRDNPFGDLLDFDALAQSSEPGDAQGGTNRGLRPVGLAPANPDRGTLVAYAARDGQRALDGSGDNSPFALALMEALPEENVEISLAFRKVRDLVLQATGNLQEPHTYGSLSGTPFFLAGNKGEAGQTGVSDRRVSWALVEDNQETQLEALAQQGDTRSMVGLAYIRLNTADKRYAPSEAAEYLMRAAEDGSAEAQFELAQLYETGLGVPQEFDTALSLYEAAAEQGFADAINDLGIIYFQAGLGVVRNPEKALAFFREAADLGQPQAMFNFAAMIDDGLIAGKGPKESADYLYGALRAGSEIVYETLRDNPTMFKVETRKALQRRLKKVGYYSSTIDGQFGAGTQRGIRSAYGLN